MNFGQTAYLTKEAFSIMKRHKGISFISVIIMSLSLLILAVFLLVTDNMLMFMEKTKKEMKIYAYLSEDVSEGRRNDIYRKIISDGYVDNVIFISKEQALHEFENQVGEDSKLLEAMETNPLPASFRISPKSEFKDKESIETLVGRLEKIEGIEEVNYGKEFLDRFASITKAFLYIDAVIGLIVVLSSLLIIANTVRLAVVGRKEMINILKLVGATDGFITTPFLIEGAFQSTIAAGFSLLLLYVFYSIARGFLPALGFFSMEKAFLYVVVCLAVGAGGSLAALRRFLRV